MNRQKRSVRRFRLRLHASEMGIVETFCSPDMTEFGLEKERNVRVGSELAIKENGHRGITTQNVISSKRENTISDAL
jgi:hypothetical protein